MKGAFVIGSGLAGLISGFVLDVPVIGEKIGGQMASSFPLGPRILEYNEDTVWLLNQLGIKAKPREFRVGYLSFDQLQVTQVSSTPPEGFKEKYYEKTRGLKKPPSSALSGGKNVIVGWDMEDIELVPRLLQRVLVIPQKLSKIDLYENEIYLSTTVETDDATYNKYDRVNLPYKKIISTIPLPILSNILRLELDPGTFQSYGTKFHHVYSYLEMTELEDYDYIYSASSSTPWHRVTKMSPHNAIFEVREDRELSFSHLEAKMMAMTFVPRAQIKPSGLEWIPRKMAEEREIELVGRYAEWNHGVKTEDVIRKVRQLAKQMGN